jgi:hypothetical protein
VTAPNEPTPGAPATEPTAAPETAPGAPEQTAEDITSLPDWAQKQIRDARSEAAKSRTTAKQTAAQEARDQLTAQIAKALGIGQEGEPVSAEDLAGQIEDAQTAAWVSTVELQIYRTAAALGADADALLDSNAFRQSIDDLGDEDPRTPEFAEQLKAKVQAALESKPDKYRAAGQAPASPTAPRPDPSQGSRGPAVARPTSLGDAIAQHMAAQKR